MLIIPYVILQYAVYRIEIVMVIYMFMLFYYKMSISQNIITVHRWLYKPPTMIYDELWLQVSQRMIDSTKQALGRRLTFLKTLQK